MKNKCACGGKLAADNKLLRCGFCHGLTQVCMECKSSRNLTCSHCGKTEKQYNELLEGAGKK